MAQMITLCLDHLTQKLLVALKRLEKMCDRGVPDLLRRCEHTTLAVGVDCEITRLLRKHLLIMLLALLSVTFLAKLTILECQIVIQDGAFLDEIGIFNAFTILRLCY